MTADLGGERPESLSHGVGSGLLKRDRDGSPFLQGVGQWHLQSNLLSKPSMCVEWYTPALLLDSRFEPDGRLADEGDSLDRRVAK